VLTRIPSKKISAASIGSAPMSQKRFDRELPFLVIQFLLTLNHSSAHFSAFNTIHLRFLENNMRR
jgi:hypothetical protein